MNQQQQEQISRQEQQRYLEEVLATVKSPGWKYLLQDFAEQKETRSTLTGISTLEQLWFNKGIVDNIVYLEGLKDVFQQALEQFEEGDDVQSS